MKPTPQQHIKDQAQLWRQTARHMCGNSLSKHGLDKDFILYKCKQVLDYDPALIHVYRTAITKASRNHAAWIRKQIGTGQERYVFASGPSIERRKIISQQAGWESGNHIVWSGQYGIHRHLLSDCYLTYQEAALGLAANRAMLIKEYHRRLIGNLDQNQYHKAQEQLSQIIHLEAERQYWEMRAQLPEDFPTNPPKR